MPRALHIRRARRGDYRATPSIPRPTSPTVPAADGFRLVVACRRARRSDGEGLPLAHRRRKAIARRPNVGARRYEMIEQTPPSRRVGHLKRLFRLLQAKQEQNLRRVHDRLLRRVSRPQLARMRSSRGHVRPPRSLDVRRPAQRRGVPVAHARAIRARVLSLRRRSRPVRATPDRSSIAVNTRFQSRDSAAICASASATYAPAIGACSLIAIAPSRVEKRLAPRRGVRAVV